MKRILICALMALTIMGCINPRNPKPTPPSNISRETLLSEHNHYRENRTWPLPAIAPLYRHEKLDSFAQKHAEWMAHNDLLRHSNLDVPEWNRVGENIAWGQKDEIMVTRQWMNSPGHRANIMNPRFTHVGFGFAKSSDGQIYWCAVFGG